MPIDLATVFGPPVGRTRPERNPLLPEEGEHAII
jgi:hypothetical protein